MYFKLVRASLLVKSEPCCVSGIKDCNLPTSCQPCKDILQCLFTNLARSDHKLIIIWNIIHLFSDSHPFGIAVVKELVITVQPFPAFFGPLDSPGNRYSMITGKWVYKTCT